MQRAKILIVDDEVEILRVLEKTLEDDFEVVTCSRAKEALEMVDDSFQVILSDQRMPEMSGSDFFRIVREKHPQIVRIIMSGYSDMNALISSVNHGEIFRYINKPWEFEELMKTLHLAIEKHKETITHRQLVDENKHLIERNREVASRLTQTMEELKRLQTELAKLNKRS
jgi:two-component system, sensor histidine kinase and response regulator